MEQETMNTSTKQLEKNKETIATPPPTKERESNMELLRVVCMLLVLIVHADYLSLGGPTPADCHSSQGESFIKIAVYSLSTVCVNCFVLLSGWYGIRPKLRRFCDLLSQVLFICGLSLCGYLALSHSRPDLEDIKSLLLLTDDLWFVRSYIVLYLFAPALNAFSSWASKRQFALTLTGLFLAQTLFGWQQVVVAWFDGGYSPLSLMLLYLLAQYIRRYGRRLSRISAWQYALAYGGLTLTGALINFASLYYGIGEGMAWLSYISPIVILNSVALLLFFTRLSFRSRWVNWVASSCFAVYLLHCTRHVLDVYCDTVRGFYGDGQLWGIAVMIVGVYVVAVLVDKVRMRVFKFIVESLKFKD